MGKICACVVLALLGSGATAAQRQTPGEAPAPPFWEARPFVQWTAEETLALLTDSPWTRPATVVEPGAELHLGRMRYYVQWYSAPPVREALVRLRQLKGKSELKSAAQFVQGHANAYELYVFAAFFAESGNFRVLPLEAFDEMTPEELEASARLVFSAQEHAGRPDRVEFVRHPETQRLVGVRLTFEEARAAVPPEAAREGQAQLFSPTRRGSLSASFRLDQMQRHGQPAL